MRAQTVFFFAAAFFQLSQQDNKLTSTQPNLPAIPSWPKHKFGKGKVRPHL